jgi:hypothetical protein
MFSSSKSLMFCALALATVACGQAPDSSEGSNPPDSKGRFDPFPDPDPVAATAEVIVIGFVSAADSFHSRTDQSERIETVATLRVERAERGTPDSELLIWTPGGIVGDLTQRATHAAEFRVGERSRLFLELLDAEALARLEQNSDLATHIVGRPVYRVRNGELGKQDSHLASALHSGGGGPQNGFTYSPCSSAPVPSAFWFEWEGPVRYFVNNNTADLGGEEVAVRMGFDAWEDEPSSRIDFAFAGLTTSTFFGNDGVNRVFWVPEGQMSHPLHAAETITTCWTSTGELLDADVRFNDGLTWSTSGVNLIQHTAMHEVGHVLGLGHISDINQIMFPTMTTKTSLGWGDRNGVRALYPGPEIPAVGDFDGNGFDDIVAFKQSAGEVWVSMNEFNSSGAFGQNRRWRTSFAPLGEWPLTGDFNGDGKTDIVRFTMGESADVHVCLADRFIQAFTNCSVWHTDFAPQGHTPAVGDFDGDGDDDVASFSRGVDADVWVALSTRTGFGPKSKWREFFAPAGEVPLVGDVDGDGDDDIVAVVNGAGTGSFASKVFVSLSNRSGFGAPVEWSSDFCGLAGNQPFIGSLHGDSRADLLCRTATTTSQSGVTYALAKSGGGFGPQTSANGTVASFTETVFAGRFPVAGSLLKFTHCTAADAIVRQNSLTSNFWFGAQLWNDFFVPGPCP